MHSTTFLMKAPWCSQENTIAGVINPCHSLIRLVTSDSANFTETISEFPHI